MYISCQNIYKLIKLVRNYQTRFKYIYMQFEDETHKI